MQVLSLPPCPSPATITKTFLLSLLCLSPVLATTDTAQPGNSDAAGIFGSCPPAEKQAGRVAAVGADNHVEFSLRHILHHGAYRYPGQLRRLDIEPDVAVAVDDAPSTHIPRPVHRISGRPRPITRLIDRSRETIEAQISSFREGLAMSYTADAWITEEVIQPNITDKETVLALAEMAADAYIKVNGTEDWLDVGYPYNITEDYGWEGDGLRGHIWANQDNSTVVISVKGTSPALFDGAETTTNDKVNDNLFFSCCCARISYWWSTVCDCYTDTYTCNSVCLKEALLEENRYYYASRQLYNNVTSMYPDSTIWVVGHSLGGAVSSLMGQTFGTPVVTFEAPSEALAAERIGLPQPPNASRKNTDIGVFHFGHTADPIYMGTCNGPTSICAIGGYAMETQCHAGMTCTYDPVGDCGWRMGLGYHKIQSVIKDVIIQYNDVPECEFVPDCVDCFNWKYVTGNETSTTSSSTSTTSTSTSTCKTPGWWGCRDETSTTTTTGTSTTSSRPITTTRPVPVPTSTSTTTCKTYGWFGGCLDATSTSSVPAIPSTRTTPVTATATSTASCSHHGWFGGCVDPTSTETQTAPSPAPTRSSRNCRRPGIFGGCWDPWFRNQFEDL